jgi:glycosyltransferase involved in cell wall biosynthesis
VTVVKNGERYIETAIQSVLNQTYENVEYILVDGLSTDSTLDIIKRYEDRIAYWVSEPDNGLYDAMNKGIALSSGSIVGILSSDDWYEFDCIRQVVQCFTRDPAIGVVHGDAREWRQDGTVDTVAAPRRGRFSIYVSIPVNQVTCFVARNVYERVGAFDTKYRIVADYELILRMYKHRVRFCYVPRILANRRGGGVSNRPGAWEVVRRESHQARRELGINPAISLVATWYAAARLRAFQILQRWGARHLISFYRRCIR